MHQWCVQCVSVRLRILRNLMAHCSVVCWSSTSVIYKLCVRTDAWCALLYIPCHPCALQCARPPPSRRSTNHHRPSTRCNSKNVLHQLCLPTILLHSFACNVQTCMNEHTLGTLRDRHVIIVKVLLCKTCRKCDITWCVLHE